MQAYSDELKALQTALLTENLPALTKDLSLSKSKTAELREYLADKSNLYRFFFKNDCDARRTADQLLDTLRWRATENLPFLSSSPIISKRLMSRVKRKYCEDMFSDGRVNRYLQSGVFYFHGRDPQGRPIGWLNLTKYRRDLREGLDAFVVYVFEVARRMLSSEEAAGATCSTKARGKALINGAASTLAELGSETEFKHGRQGSSRSVTWAAELLQFVIVVDLKGVELSQLDTEVVPLLVRIYKRHYPGSVGGIHVLNYGWIYAGMWAIAKRVLPAESKRRISFPVDDAEAAELLGYENLSAEQGGHSNYKYDGPENNDVYAQFGLPNKSAYLDEFCAESRSPAGRLEGSLSVDELRTCYPPLTPRHCGEGNSHLDETGTRRSTGVLEKAADLEDEAVAVEHETVVQRRWSDDESEYFSATDEREICDTRMSFWRASEAATPPTTSLPSSLSSSRHRPATTERKRRRRAAKRHHKTFSRGQPQQDPTAENGGFLGQVNAESGTCSTCEEARTGPGVQAANAQPAGEASESTHGFAKGTRGPCSFSRGEGGWKSEAATRVACSVIDGIGTLLWGSAYGAAAGEERLAHGQHDGWASSFWTGSLLEYPNLNTAIWEDRRPQQKPVITGKGNDHDPPAALTIHTVEAGPNDRGCGKAFPRDSEHSSSDTGHGGSYGPGAETATSTAVFEVGDEDNDNGDNREEGRTHHVAAEQHVKLFALQQVCVSRRLAALLLVVAVAVGSQVRAVVAELHKWASPQGNSCRRKACTPTSSLTPSWPLWVLVAVVRAASSGRSGVQTIRA